MANQAGVGESRTLLRDEAMDWHCLAIRPTAVSVPSLSLTLGRVLPPAYPGRGIHKNAGGGQ